MGRFYDLSICWYVHAILIYFPSSEGGEQDGSTANIKNDSGKVLRAKGTPYQVRDYITCLHLAYEGEDLGQSQLYGHTFARLEEEVDQGEDQEASCQGANVEHHVQEEEV